MKAPEVVTGSGLPVGHNGRVKVDQHLRAIDHPEIYVAGDLASVTNPATAARDPADGANGAGGGRGRGDEPARRTNGKPLKPSATATGPSSSRSAAVGGSRRSPGATFGGRAAHLLKDAIEWEYRQSVKYLQGWTPVA